MEDNNNDDKNDDDKVTKKSKKGRNNDDDDDDDASRSLKSLIRRRAKIKDSYVLQVMMTIMKEKSQKIIHIITAAINVTIITIDSCYNLQDNFNICTM